MWWSLTRHVVDIHVPYGMRLPQCTYNLQVNDEHRWQACTWQVMWNHLKVNLQKISIYTRYRCMRKKCAHGKFYRWERIQRLQMTVVMKIHKALFGSAYWHYKKERTCFKVDRGNFLSKSRGWWDRCEKWTSFIHSQNWHVCLPRRLSRDAIRKFQASRHRSTETLPSTRWLGI